MEKYLKEIITLDLLHKNLQIMDYEFSYNYGTNFVDFLKYDAFVFSRIFRDLRYTFWAYDQVVLASGKLKRKNRKKEGSIRTIKSINGYGMEFWMLFEYLLIEVFRKMLKNNAAIYLKSATYFIIGTKVGLQRYELTWNDLYSRLFDLSNMIGSQTNYLYKYDIPKMSYSFRIITRFLPVLDLPKICVDGGGMNYFEGLNLDTLVFLSFFGFKFFFKKRKFPHTYFARII